MYSYDEAKVKLEENDNNYMLVIKTALGINEPKTNDVTMIYVEHPKTPAPVKGKIPRATAFSLAGAGVGGRGDANALYL